MDPFEDYTGFKSNENIEKSDYEDTTAEKNIVTSTIETISTDEESERSEKIIISSTRERISTDGVCSSNPSYEVSERSEKIIISSASETISTDGVCRSNPSYEESEESYFINLKNKCNCKGEETEVEKEVPSFNNKALPSHANTYQLERFERNAMIIFNHEKVEGYKDRKGTLKDEETLRDTFSKFGFEVHETKRNLKRFEIFNALKEFSAKNFTNYGCVVIAVLTHGASNGLLEASDEGYLYSEQEILSYFKTQTKGTLATKPIILIIQACRGKGSTKGVEIRNISLRSKTIEKDAKEEFVTYFLPVESDILVFHSSYPGKPAYRPDDGSWFIQTLCKQINQLYRTHDLESIFTEVKREVAIDKCDTVLNPDTGEHDVHKQMPIVTSTLIRKLYLRRYNDRPPIMAASVPHDSSNQTFTDLELQSERPPYCDCYKDYFDYMKACLRNVVKNYPRDEIARSLLSLAEKESGINEDDVKNKLKLINHHIGTHYKDKEFYKFIYFSEAGSQMSFANIETGTNDSLIHKKWMDCYSTGAFTECCSLKNFVFVSMVGVIAYYTYGWFHSN